VSTLVGVGVGPGDPELITVKALRRLRAADVVFVPVADTGETGRAEATVRHHVDGGVIVRVVFAMRDQVHGERREGAWDAAATQVADWFATNAGGTAAFATLGDPCVYSTFTYLAQTVRDLVGELTVELVPGVTAMQDLAARSGTPLVEGRESLALFPMTAGAQRFRQALDSFDTVVAYKFGRLLPETLAVLAEAGRLDDAVFGAGLGLPSQDIRPARELPPDAAGPYLSTLIIPARRDGRGSKL
jgi:precorrin-2/cobalt-factor-2 C20-methyltransferase